MNRKNDLSVVQLLTLLYDEKEERYEQEKRLLLALKKHFFIDDISCLSRAFEEGKLCHLPQVIVSVFEWILCEEEIQKRIISEYFEFIK